MPNLKKTDHPAVFRVSGENPSPENLDYPQAFFEKAKLLGIATNLVIDDVSDAIWTRIYPQSNPSPILVQNFTVIDLFSCYAIDVMP